MICEYTEICHKELDEPDSIVFLFHGYGSNAKDMTNVARHISNSYKNTVFVSLQGPYHMSNMTSYTINSFEWYDVTDEDAHKKIQFSMMLKQVKETIEAKVNEYNLSYDKVFLVGFSQGSMVALHLIAYINVCAVVNFSGFLENFDMLTKEVKGSPKIFFINGEDDLMVPYQSLDPTLSYLRFIGVECDTTIIPNIGHIINKDCLNIAVSKLKPFMQKSEEEILV